jgi:glycopeptide antibiotics resistance protein
MPDTIDALVLLGLAAAAVYAACEAVIWDALLKKHRPLARRLLSYAFTVYLVVLIRLSVLPGVTPGSHGSEISVSLIPFQSIGLYFNVFLRYGMAGVFAVNILGNILLLLPMGFFLPYFMRRKTRWWKMLLISAGLSAGIELVQFLLAALGWDSGRVVDIDDVILNALGGLMGYWVYLAAEAVRKKAEQRTANNGII